MSTPSTAPSRRIELLDVARGFAVLGILAINIDGFAYPSVTEKFPMLFGNRTGLDLALWGGLHFFFEGKMRALFCMLFGAGVMLYAERRPNSAELWLRRCLWLSVFGVLHAYVLMWRWDILFYYGMAGLWLFPFRNVAYRKLIAIILAWWMVMATLTTLDHLEGVGVERRGEAALALKAQKKKLSAQHEAAIDDYELQREARTPNAESIAEEAEQRLGGWGANYGLAFAQAYEAEAKPFYHWEILEVFMTMLVGVMLYRRKFLTGERSRADYARLAKLAYGFAVPLQLVMTLNFFRVDFDIFSTSNALLSAWLYDLVRWAMAIGHLSLLALLVKSPGWSRLMYPLGAAGRMALTNYLLQSIVCGFLFYGIGLGWFAQRDRTELMLVILAVWFAELGWSLLWFMRFDVGPVEWAWRSLVAGRRLPLRRSAPTGEPISPMSPVGLPNSSEPVT